MTAANLIVVAGAAHLLVDRGSYHDDGTLLAIGPKWIADERLRLAMTLSGCAAATAYRDLATWLSGLKSQREFLSALPAHLTAMERYNLASMAEGGSEYCGPMPTFVQAYVALWSIERRQPEAYICGSSHGTFAGYQPGQVCGVGRVLQPMTQFEVVSDQFDVAAARELIELQRQETDERGIHRVGGGADMASVSRDGIKVEPVVCWREDRVGRKIQPGRKAYAWLRPLAAGRPRQRAHAHG